MSTPPTPSALGSMQELENTRREPLDEVEQHSVPTAVEQWPNTRAAYLVQRSFEHMTQYKQGHMLRWDNADEVFLGWRPAKNWEGTKKPRAAVPILLAFEIVESLMPAVMAALFPLYDNVEIYPRPGTNIDEARATFELIMSQFDSLGEDQQLRLREVVRRCFHSAFVYGNGIIEVGWLYKQIEYLKVVPEWMAPRMQQVDPTTGQLIMMPNPDAPPQRVLREKKVVEMINQPHLMDVDLRSFYIDPNCRTPVIQDARFAGVIDYPTVEEVASMRGQDYYDVPDDRRLVEMAMRKTNPADEQRKRSPEINSRHPSNWNPGLDYSDDPAHLRIERKRWYSRDRCIWLLNDNWVCYNRTNPYNVIPFLNLFYVDVPGRFYGMAITDVVEGDQRTIASTREARLDELSMAINSPIISTRGGDQFPMGTLALHPGKVIYKDNPKTDLIKMEWPNITADSHIEIEAAYSQARRTTGQGEAATMGAAPVGGNSAQRTSAGMNIMAQAVSRRVGYIVENSETNFFEPLFQMIHQFNRVHLPRDQAAMVLGEDAQYHQYDPLGIINANVKFRFKASDKLRSQQQLIGQLPWLVQNFTNPDLIKMLQTQQGMTLDVKQLMLLVTDPLHIPPMSLFRKMSEEEVQAANAPPPEENVRLLMQRERIAGQEKIALSEQEAKLLLMLFQRLLTPEAVNDFLNVEHPSVEAAKLRPKLTGKPNGGGR